MADFITVQVKMIGDGQYADMSLNTSHIRAVLPMDDRKATLILVTSGERYRAKNSFSAVMGALVRMGWVERAE